MTVLSFRKIPWGELVVPLAAVCYMIYTVGYQMMHHFRTATINYTIYLCLPIAISVCVILIRIFSAQPVQKEKSLDGDYLTVGLFLVLTIAMVLLINFFGYILDFFLYLISCLWLMGTRSVPKILTISAGVVVFVILVFGLWLELPLPAGLLKGLL